MAYTLFFYSQPSTLRVYSRYEPIVYDARSENAVITKAEKERQSVGVTGIFSADNTIDFLGITFTIKAAPDNSGTQIGIGTDAENQLDLLFIGLGQNYDIRKKCEFRQDYLYSTTGQIVSKNYGTDLDFNMSTTEPNLDVGNKNAGVDLELQKNYRFSALLVEDIVGVDDKLIRQENVGELIQAGMPVDAQSEVMDQDLYTLFDIQSLARGLTKPDLPFDKTTFSKLANSVNLVTLYLTEVYGDPESSKAVYHANQIAILNANLPEHKTDRLKPYVGSFASTYLYTLPLADSLNRSTIKGVDDWAHFLLLQEDIVGNQTVLEKDVRGAIRFFFDNGQAIEYLYHEVSSTRTSVVTLPCGLNNYPANDEVNVFWPSDFGTFINGSLADIEVLCGTATYLIDKTAQPKPLLKITQTGRSGGSPPSGCCTNCMRLSLGKFQFNNCSPTLPTQYTLKAKVELPSAFTAGDLYVEIWNSLGNYTVDVLNGWSDTDGTGVFYLNQTITLNAGSGSEDFYVVVRTSSDFILSEEFKIHGVKISSAEACSSIDPDEVKKYEVVFCDYINGSGFDVTMGYLNNITLRSYSKRITYNVDQKCGKEFFYFENRLGMIESLKVRSVLDATTDFEKNIYESQLEKDHKSTDQKVKVQYSKPSTVYRGIFERIDQSEIDYYNAFLASNNVFWLKDGVITSIVVTSSKSLTYHKKLKPTNSFKFILSQNQKGKTA